MVKAKFTFQTPQQVNASFSVGQRESVGAGFSADITGTHDHDALFNRDLPDQHPVEAITGLADTLSGLTEGVSTIQETIGGFGDIVTASTLSVSRNHTLGVLYGQKIVIDENETGVVFEGKNSIITMKRLCDERNIDSIIVNFVNDVIIEKLNPEIAFELATS